MNLIELAERGILPDWLIRIGIRRLAAQRYRIEAERDIESFSRHSDALRNELSQSPIALHCDDANDQHYEVPAEFFRVVLGPRLKYSCCLFPDETTTLTEAEEQMLELTCRRADIRDGMDVLDLGCGWGSLSLWIAAQMPNCRITAVSNSHGQREHIESECCRRGLHNVRVLTADMRDFTPDRQFDRVVSVEMFEHMRNYDRLLNRISHWLVPDGKLLVHIFCHRTSSYLFETEGDDNWMGREFFTGGIMPADDLLLHFQNDMVVERHWRVSGLHYWRTCEAWLANLDRYPQSLVALFERSMSRAAAKRALQRWRIFLMACAETFRYNGGREWFVSHYLFRNRPVEVRTQETAADFDAVEPVLA